MLSAPKRSNSLRRSLEKVGDVLHLHRESSKHLSIKETRHGCRSDEEVQALKHLQEELQAQNVTLPPDMIYAGDLECTLLRFLRARKYDVDATVHKLKGCIHWRKENNIDKILQNPLDPKKLEVIRKYKPSSYIGFDKEGRPIYMDRVGMMDIPAIYAGGVTDHDVIMYHIQEMEFMGRVLLKEASERVGHTVDSVVMVLDVSGLRLSALTGPIKNLFRQLVSLDQDNYPETNGGTQVVHASLVFTTVWGILKPFLDKGTAAKVQVLGHGKKAEAHLLELFGAERLPTFLGGEIDFDSCRAQWAVKMDAALEEAGRKARDLELRKERRLSASRTPSLPGTPVSRTPSTATADTVAAAAAIAETAPWKVRRGSSGSQVTSPIGATGAASASATSSPGTAGLKLDVRAASTSSERPPSPSSAASTSGPAANGPSAGGPAISIPSGLAPLRLERVSGGGSSVYDDADEFYTPKSALSRASSVSSVYADALDVNLDGFLTPRSSSGEIPLQSSPQKEKAAAFNAKDVSPSNTVSLTKSHPPDLDTIDESKASTGKQPMCKCTIM